MEPKAELSLLSSGQRACLHLVQQHRSSKEIARLLGISPHTVDQRLRVAVRILGVSTRFEAARLLMEGAPSEGADLYQPLIYQTPGLAAETNGDSYSEALTLARSSADQIVASGTLQALDATNFATSGLGTAGHFWPVRAKSGERNDLNLGMRALWMATIAVVSMFAFGILVVGLEGLSRVL
ncbi:MAG: hypothetical protein RIS52_15 [Pseudomonadota bacterium]|jgi:DNA-binding CsgD family transcriptional regulator